MAALSTQAIVPGGVTLSFSSAAAGGDTIAAPQNDERTAIYVKNGGGSSITVTVAPVAPTSARVGGVGTVTVPNISKSIGAGSEAIIGPFAAAYIDATGNISVGYSAVTSVTVAAIRMPAVSI